MKRSICTHTGCGNPVFAKKLCKFHQHLRTDDKKPKPIGQSAKKLNNFSQSKIKDLAIYRPRRDKFLEENPTCMHPGCNGKSTLHHALGRIGELLYNEKYFRNLCWKHHQKAELDPAWAYKNNYSIRRNEKERH